MKIPPATRAKWLAEKAGWRLANRGDTWYAAERRLYKRQMTELRKSLHLEDLQRRRAEYVAARDAPPKVYEHDEDELESKAESARYLLLRAAATGDDRWVVALHYRIQRKRLWRLAEEVLTTHLDELGKDDAAPAA